LESHVQGRFAALGCSIVCWFYFTIAGVYWASVLLERDKKQAGALPLDPAKGAKSLWNPVYKAASRPWDARLFAGSILPLQVCFGHLFYGAGVKSKPGALPLDPAKGAKPLWNPVYKAALLPWDARLFAGSILPLQVCFGHLFCWNGTKSKPGVVI